jgi:hypothetical protein
LILLCIFFCILDDQGEEQSLDELNSTMVNAPAITDELYSYTTATDMYMVGLLLRHSQINELIKCKYRDSSELVNMKKQLQSLSVDLCDGKVESRKSASQAFEEINTIIEKVWLKS